MLTKNEIVKELTESFRKDIRDGHGARRIAERVANELIALHNDFERMLGKIKAEFDADIAELRQEMASTVQDFEGIMRRPNNVVSLPPRP